MASLPTLAGNRLFAGSVALLVNTVVLSVFGFAFSVVAARTYPASSVGLYAGFNSGSQLLGMVAALGWSLALARFLPTEPEPRALLLLMTATVVLLGGLLVLAIELIAGDRLFSSVGLSSSATNVMILLLLVIATSLGAVTTPGLISRRVLRPLVLANLIGALARVGLLVPLSALGTDGLVGAYTAGTVLGIALLWAALWRNLPLGHTARGLTQRAARYLRYSALAYLSSLLGIIPMTVMPLIVLTRLGSTRAAWFTMAFSIVALLGLVPSTVAQVLFAEAGNEPQRLRRNTIGALKGIYAILVPGVVVLVLAAHLLLSVLGPGYAAHGSAVLRITAVGTLALGGTYVVDSFLAAVDRMTSYLLVNLLNAVLVVGFVLLAVHGGIRDVAISWALANACSLAVGICILGGPRALGAASRYASIVASRL